VEVDLAAAQRYGMAPGDIRRAASTFFSGTLVGSLYQDQRIFDVVVWGAPQTRHAPGDLADLLINTPSAGQVRVGDLATVRIVPFPTELRHDNSTRYVDIDAGVSGRDIGAVLSDVRGRVAAMPMPLEYHAEVLSDMSLQQGQDRTMLALALGAAVLIFLLLQAAFGSWRLATLAFAMLPLVLVGGVAANVLAGGELSLAAMLGLFAVLALAARQIVLLVSGYRYLEATEPGTGRVELVVQATRDRVGSILLTVLATAAVFVPVMVAGSRAGTEVLRPMAAVVLGGLVSSTVVLLFVLPALYLRLSPVVGHHPAPRRARWRPRGAQAATDSRLGEG
jgi:Cu/Ag efflux pump CusA